MKFINTLLILNLVVLLSISTVSAQVVGVGTVTPNTSTALDIDATDMGILIPRVALTSTGDTSTVTGTGTYDQGLWVYNTSTVSDVVPGFYFWKNGRWESLLITAPPVVESEWDLDASSNGLYLNTTGSSSSDASGQYAVVTAGNQTVTGNFSFSANGTLNSVLGNYSITLSTSSNVNLIADYAAIISNGGTGVNEGLYSLNLASDDPIDLSDDASNNEGHNIIAAQNQGSIGSETGYNINMLNISSNSDIDNNSFYNALLLGANNNFEPNSSNNFSLLDLGSTYDDASNFNSILGIPTGTFGSASFAAGISHNLIIGVGNVSLDNDATYNVALSNPSAPGTVRFNSNSNFNIAFGGVSRLTDTGSYNAMGGSVSRSDLDGGDYNAILINNGTDMNVTTHDYSVILAMEGGLIDTGGSHGFLGVGRNTQLQNNSNFSSYLIGHSAATSGTTFVQGDYCTFLAGDNNDLRDDVSYTTFLGGGEGNDARTNANYALYFGEDIRVDQDSEIMFGFDPDNDASTTFDRLFTIGTNYGFSPSRDAISILQNGRFGLGWDNFSDLTQTHLFSVNGSGDITGTVTTISAAYPDYVFEAFYNEKRVLKNEQNEQEAYYSYKSLAETWKYIQKHGHLPGVTGIKELPKKKGRGVEVQIDKLALQNLEKIEELFLYTFEHENKIDGLKQKLSEKLESIKKR